MTEGTDTDKMLRRIFGKRYDELTDEALDAARTVGEWMKRNYKGYEKNTCDKRHSDEILKGIVSSVVSEYVGATPEEVFGKTRLHSIVEMRYIAYAVLRELTGYSFSETARHLGAKADHTTVAYGISKVNEWCEYDKYFRERYYTVRDRIYERIENLSLESTKS